eukprot:tig00000615_g2611.t1
MSETVVGFEGPEKKLEIDFTCVVGDGLRIFTEAQWQECCTLAKCTILNRTSNDDFDAYVLSESSLFVYRHKVILKTCGTTVLLNTIPKVLEFAGQIGAKVEFVRFCRSNFNFPGEQPFPHSSFDDEVAFLDQYFEGASYILGPLNGNRWNLYIADYTKSPEQGEIEQQLEIQMGDLDPEVMKAFFKTDPSVTPKMVTESSGIGALFKPGTLIDDYVFEPCGYSMNGLFGKSYYTIHITPESHCSYVSFETNLPEPDYTDLINRVIDTFKPGKLSVTLFADDRSPAGDLSHAFSSDLHGFVLKDRTVQRFQDCYSVLSCKYILKEKEPSKEHKIRKINDHVTRLLPRTLSAMLHPHPTYAEMLERIVGEYGVERVSVDAKTSDLVAQKIAREGAEEAFFLVDLGVVTRKHARWKALMPRVDPFYVVKCNPNPALLATLSALDCGFECSSKAEIVNILDLGVDPSRVLYANPCKMASQIKFAQSSNCSLLCFDNEPELHKIGTSYPEARLLLRISPAGLKPKQPGSRFGASLEEVPGLLRAARALGVCVVGVSFHVDVGASVEGRRAALREARAVFDQMEEAGFPPSILDIGGGFPASDVASPTFEEIAAGVAPLLDELFDPSVRVIAEPGRYFAGESFTLCTQIFAKKVAHNAEGPEKASATLYYINDGIYGSFNCVLFDGACPTPLPVAKRPDLQLRQSTLFGPTCDSLDCVAKNVMLPELNIGDWLYFTGMGAYTVSSQTAFNGFSGPRVYYIMS